MNSTHNYIRLLPKILINGLEPFLKHRVNPSGRIVTMLNSKPPLECSLTTNILPVTFDACRHFADRRTFLNEFDIILMLGLSVKGRRIELERIAINLEDSKTPDNSGYKPSDHIIHNGGPDGIFSQLPFKRIQERLKRKRIPCSMSNSAGTYVCNSLFYSVQRICRNTGISSGFIHLPPVSPQWALTRQIRAVRAVIQVCVDEYHER